MLPRQKQSVGHAMCSVFATIVWNMAVTRMTLRATMPTAAVLRPILAGQEGHIVDEQRVVAKPPTPASAA